MYADLGGSLKAAIIGPLFVKEKQTIDGSIILNKPTPTPWLAYLGLTLTALFWAGNAVVGRSVVDTIPPLSLSFYRWSIALCILLPFGLAGVWRQRQVIAEHFWPLLLLSALSVGAFNTLLYLSALTTTALNISLVASTIPIMVAFLAWLILGERLRLSQTLGILLALLGILVVISRGQWSTLSELSFHPGDLIMVAAVSCWGLFSVLLRRHAVPLAPLTFLTVQVGLGVLVISPFYLVDLLFISGGFVVDASVIPPLAYVAIFPGLLAYAFWNNGVHSIGPSRAAVFMYLGPIFTAVLAGLFLGERMSLFYITGGILILAGLLLTTRQVPISPAAVP
ncbi:MAG: EamA family transporter [unclassified Hahellaceae]|nr:EamA family transporter [Hahellaceae bacterium]|tara:strand:- start:38097 stop:39110 length:1014 start_codon:yes stop_codon:yes gene_type:complete